MYFRDIILESKAQDFMDYIKSLSKEDIEGFNKIVKQYTDDIAKLITFGKYKKVSFEKPDSKREFTPRGHIYFADDKSPNLNKLRKQYKDDYDEYLDAVSNAEDEYDASGKLDKSAAVIKEKLKSFASANNFDITSENDRDIKLLNNENSVEVDYIAVLEYDEDYSEFMAYHMIELCVTKLDLSHNGLHW